MRTDPHSRTPWVLAAVIALLVPVDSQAQHVHGIVELGIVVEGDTIAVSIHAPLSDVVGFEHAPEDDSQRASIERAAAMLSDAGKMFGLAESAACTVSKTMVEGPDYVEAHLAAETGTAGDDHDDEDHGHDGGHDDHHDDDHGHDNGHDDHHDEDHGHESGHDDHDDHEHGGDEQHSEVNAEYAWTCENAADVKTVELRFIDGFAGVENIEVQIITASGVSVQNVGADAKSISLVPQ